MPNPSFFEPLNSIVQNSVHTLQLFKNSNTVAQNSPTEQTTQDQKQSIEPQMTKAEKIQLALQEKYDQLFQNLTSKIQSLNATTIDDLDKKYPNLCIKYRDFDSLDINNLIKEMQQAGTQQGKFYTINQIKTSGASAGSYFKLTSKSPEKLYFAKFGDSYNNHYFTISALREGIFGLKLLIEFFTIYNKNANSKELEIFKHIARPFLIKNDKNKYAVVSHFCKNNYETLKEISNSFNPSNNASDVSSPIATSFAIKSNEISHPDTNKTSKSNVNELPCPDFDIFENSSDTSSTESAKSNIIKFDLNSAKKMAKNLCKTIRMMHDKLGLTHNDLHAGNILVKIKENDTNATNKSEKIEDFMLIDFGKAFPTPDNKDDLEKLKELVDELLTSSTCTINSWEAGDINDILSHIEQFGSKNTVKDNSCEAKKIRH